MFVLQVCSLSPSQHESFMMSVFLGQGVVLDRRVTVSVNVFYSLVFA
jgi:hypothetical protein